MTRQDYSDEQLFQMGKDSYDKLVLHCKNLEMTGFWDKAQQVMQQSSSEVLNLYVQAVLMQLAKQCGEILESQLRFIQMVTCSNPLEISEDITVAAGVTNIVLDALFVAIFPFGIVGAAWSTAISEYVGGVIPLVYFSRHNDSLLRLTRSGFSGKVLLKGCGNGASEFLSTISMSVVSMLYNVQLMKYAGENGVAAYGTLMYVGMIFSSAFLGYSMGVAPVFGFHYGARNPVELRGLLKKSLVIIGGFSAIMFLSSELLAGPLSQLYVGYDKSLLSLTQRGFVLFSFSFLFSGFPVFGSAFFTALNNGLVSAAISFLRIGVFQILSVLILPLFLGIDGIWLSVATAEVGATVVAALFWIGNRKRYL